MGETAGLNDAEADLSVQQEDEKQSSADRGTAIFRSTENQGQ
jgi:hypothetical protein